MYLIHVHFINSLHRISHLCTAFSLQQRMFYVSDVWKKIYHDIPTIHVSMKNITCLFFFNDVIYLAERLCKIIEYYVVIFIS